VVRDPRAERHTARDRQEIKRGHQQNRSRPAYQQALKVRGFEAKGSTPGELAAFMEKDYIKNRDLIQKLGLHVD